MIEFRKSGLAVIVEHQYRLDHDSFLFQRFRTDDNDGVDEITEQIRRRIDHEIYFHYETGVISLRAWRSEFMLNKFDDSREFSFFIQKRFQRDRTEISKIQLRSS